MIFAWAKQFIAATGLFAIVLSVHTVSLLVKEQKVVKTQLQEAEKTVRVSSGNQNRFN